MLIERRRAREASEKEALVREQEQRGVDSLLEQRRQETAAEAAAEALEGERARAEVAALAEGPALGRPSLLRMRSVLNDNRR